MTPANERKLSIILVNFNGADLLKQCLDSLKASIPARTQVVVVENASRDNSLEILKAYSDWIEIVQSPVNKGFAGGNNLGMERCSGDYILLLNTDTVLRNGFLDPLVDYLDHHPKVGIVQGKMLLTRHGGGLDVCGSFMTPFGFLYHYGYYKPDGPLYSQPHPVFTVKGAFMLFRRGVVADAGGYLFNEDFFCYYEETDFCHRAWLAGWESHFVPGPAIEHYQGGTSEKVHGSSFALRQFITNQTFGLLANLAPVTLLRIMPFYALMFMASMVAGALTLNSVVFGAHWHAIVYCSKNLKKILSQRTMVKRIRRLDDRVILRKVLKMPRLEYFWKTFRGQLRDYVDEPLMEP